MKNALSVKMGSRKVGFLFLALFFISQGLYAQIYNKRINTAVPFMRISPDARSAGMGNLSLAMSPEANDLFGNTAKLPLLENKSGFLINYTPWLKDLGLTDVYLASMGYYKKLNEFSSINSSLRFFSLGDIPISDEYGTQYMNTKPSEFSFDAGYSILLTQNLSLGVSLRYINSRLVPKVIFNLTNNFKAGNTLAGDVSLYYKQNENGEGFHAGLLMSNLGGKINYTDDKIEKYFIPANLGLGLGYITKFDSDNSLEFGVDVNRLLVPAFPDPLSSRDQYFSQSVVSSWFNSFTKQYGPPLGETLKASVGAEYNYNSIFYLRTGYTYESQVSSNGQYFTIGTSFQYLQSKFNISYLVPSGGGLSRNPLSNTIRFGSIFYF